ncbi:MAG: class I SAM-dependent methyltransferase [Vulcanimicrobiota bacterium]
MWSELVQQLRRDGFNEANARRLLGVPELVDQPYFACEEESAAAAWTNFWLVGETQARSGDWVKALLQLGLLEELPAGVRTRVRLTPCEDVYLLADPEHQPDSRTYALARLVPRQPGFHLKSGAGLLPLLFGGSGQDSNPMATALAELNAQLNGRSFLEQPAPQLITLRLPLARPERGRPPANPDLEPYLEQLATGATLAVACSLVEPLQLPGFEVEQLDYARASLTDYAASLVDRQRMLRAFGPESGEQAYQIEVARFLEACPHIHEIRDSILLIRRNGGGHRIRKIAYPLAESESQALAEQPLSKDCAYNEDALRELLDLPEVLYTAEQIPGLLHRLRQHSGLLARQAEYWLLQQPRRGRRARAMLFPCLGQLIFADPIFSARPDQIYWPGPDSLVLARSVPRRPRQRSLDLCTGSGIQAVLNAIHCRQNLAVDINPRAVQRARLNARFNRVKLTVVQGSLFEPVAPGQFDLITANPPFVPTPDEHLQLFRPGGESGEEITAEIIRALPERLAEGGLLALVSQCPIITGSRALQRVRGWLGQSSGWGLAQLRFGKLDRAGLIASHTQDAEEFERWWQSYRRQGIEGAHLAVTLVARLHPGHPGFERSLDLQMPRHCISQAVDELISEWSRSPLR